MSEENIKEKKNRKPLIFLLILLVLAGGGYLYYMTQLKPDPESEYVGNWYDSYFINPDGTKEYWYSKGGYGGSAYKFNADGTFYEHTLGNDIWFETDEYLYTVGGATKYYKADDGTLYTKFENPCPEDGGEGECISYMEKH